EVVTHRSCDGSALTAACCISSDVMLVSTALGSLFAVDRRTGGDVWRSSSDANGVPTSLGPPSGVSSLFCDSRAYGAAVATLGGGVALFDLRFQLLLEQYRLPGANGKQALSPMENPHAILCLCPDTSCASSEQMTSRPGLLLGTRSGTVHHLDLATGKSHIALQPFCTGKATRALLLQPKHAVVFTAGDEMQIRRWCLSSPSRSATVVCPPFSSHSYAKQAAGAIVEVRDKKRQNHTDSAVVSSPASSATQRGVVLPQHHDDAILTLCSLHLKTSSSGSGAGEVHLVSGSRDGRLTVWLNAG
ncbi:protein kinase, partial [Trypanosoma vivax Y486]